ncbi:MAG: transcription-repair coupling factor [Nitrospiraceae bacterium]|nr:MAG: transcription-repair coupling factor [Nitrospiraceae bacterium]
MPLDLSVFDKALAAIERSEARFITSLAGSSGPLLACSFKKPYLLITSSEEKAITFRADAVFWSRVLSVETPVLINYPGTEERMKSLEELYSRSQARFITSVDAAIAPLWAKEEFPIVSLTRGQTIDRDHITDGLRKQGYLTVHVVAAAGEMSVRGGIIDVFSPDKEHPLRIEFFGDEIESLRFFDVGTQLSVEEIHDVQICPAAEPEEGVHIFDLLQDHMILIDEPDDVKKQCPELYDFISEREVIKLSSLALEGEGFNTGLETPSGLGLLREERTSLEDFVFRTGNLSSDHYIVMVCSSESQAKRLKELFIEQDISADIIPASEVKRRRYSPVITVGDISRGFVFGNVIVLAESDIFGERPKFKPSRKSNVSDLISSIEDFKEGDYLVHIEHGIGKFTGILKQRIEGFEDDFITIEYLGGDTLSVPLERINHVQKYNVPEGTKARLDRLGGKTWQRTKQKVKKKIKDMAEKLIKIYARRTSATGNVFSDDTELHREFDGFFPYEPTPDQLTSIDEIKRDMEKPLPMDRLLSGDVGYGKTEVVVRACFKAVYDGKQVAVLVPTTILAEQHYENFVTRFSAFPIKIDFLSRFKTRAEQNATLKSLADGEIDIIIGTHGLLGKSVSFFNLGLLVVDEEHKFGVTHKEKIKAMKANVDVLSLSATPIPRTLHMALSGIRSMSTIETPPEDRMAVKTTVARFNADIIRDALVRELARGGQAFFVHNRIKDIYQMGQFIQDLVMEARIGIAHGQMKEKELEQVMHKFFHKEIDILVSTAIIGSGLDVPSANTIIINRADRFGLADLYQLRGRVGRSNVKAYACLLIPGEDIITEEARKKLQAIQEMGYLGAGFRLAMKDLEIRGAGNILGAEQSGHISAIGFDMYMDMLESAVSELKGEKVSPKIETELDLNITAMISEDYIESPELRLSLYRKIATAKKEDTLSKILDELKDRFGPPPEKTKRLIDIMKLKVLASTLMITRIHNAGGRYRILFADETEVTPDMLFALHTSRKGRIKFLPEGGVELDLRGEKWNTVYKKLKELLEELDTSRGSAPCGG